MSEIKRGKYGLPVEVKYCKSCTISNQRPASTVEFKNQGEEKTTINFDEDGICDACRFVKSKPKIDWELREKELLEVCDKYRRNDGRFDVVVPGSGGKDSVMAAHLLKYKYKMNPILITWPPMLYTKEGWYNFQSWLRSGFANYTYWPNQQVHRVITRLAFENLCHPFQPFIIGQKNLAPKLSALLDIPLVMFGESEAEHGSPIAEGDSALRDEKYFSAEEELDNIYLGGVNAKDLMKEYDFTLADLEAYLPITPEKMQKTKTEVHYLGYYVPWHHHEVYYYSVEKTDFMPNFARTEGSYSKYSSFDDKIDWLHYFTIYTKFGYGRATENSSEETRNGDITREEAIALVKRFDGEFPQIYLDDCLEYMDISLERFHEVIDNARPEHLWKKENGIWKLKNPIWEVEKKTNPKASLYEWGR